MTLPLSGTRILDLSRLLPGAYASQMLADFGADVIKVEEPETGDYSRSMPPYGPGGLGLYFLATNRNKRSITLNLKTARGRDIFLALVRTADVVLESFRPGVLERLELGYDQLKEANPALIYCAISGYGQDGPSRLRAGHDLNYAGYAGLLHYTRGADGKPAMPASLFGDLAGGSLMSVIGILTALVGRGQNGEGRKIDVSMTEGVMALMPLLAASYFNTGNVPVPGQTMFDGGLPCYNIYETSDGKHVTLAALESKFWHTFCTRIGHLELLPLHRPHDQATRNHAIQLLQAVFKTRTRDEWVAELADIDSCVGPVYSLDEALNDAHAQTRGVSVSSSREQETTYTLPSFPRISGMPTSEQRYPPPLSGEHTHELLQEIGYEEPEIVQLKNEGVI